MNRQKGAWFFGWLVTRKGSGTSGNWMHKGDPPNRGGSAPGGGHAAMGIAAGTPTEEVKEAVQARREEMKAKKEKPKKEGYSFSKAGTPALDDVLKVNKKANSYLDTAATQTGDWTDPTDAERGAIKHNLVTELSKRTGIDYSLTNEMIRQWSRTSNDNDYRSLSLQEACSEEFGVPLSDWQKSKIPGSKTYQGYETKPLASRDVERKFLREMYNWTQEELAKQGFKKGDTIRMYRGVDYKIGPNVGEEFAMEQNAMSSWSVGKKIADQFSGWSGGSVFVSDMPVENILCSCLTGFGCFKEGEFLALGVPGGTGRMLK